MMQVGEYLFNQHYIRYVKLTEFDEETVMRIELTDGDHVQFSFPDYKSADKVFKFVKRKMEP